MAELPLTLELVDPHSPRVEAVWRSLERHGIASYFQSWGWIRTWLDCLPPALVPPLAVVTSGGATVAAFFLARRRLLRHGLIPTRALFLGTTGLPRFDELTVEHNAVLRDPTHPLSLDDLLGVLPPAWDELFLPALTPRAFPGSALGSPPTRHHLRVDKTAPAHYVDLDKVRAAKGGYLSLLSSGARARIRRSQRGFASLQLEVATELRQAQEIYDELVELHGRSWRARGLPGAFADEWFDRFHRTLVAARFASGEIQLSRIRSLGATIGCLYNLVSEGRVLFYQSGFADFEDPRLKPGLVCHAALVEHNAEAGHAVYDLLAGGAHYKDSLATDELPLTWARVQRPLARFAVEDRLRRLRGGLRRVVAAALRRT